MVFSNFATDLSANSARVSACNKDGIGDMIKKEAFPESLPAATPLSCLKPSASHQGQSHLLQFLLQKFDLLFILVLFGGIL